MESYGDLEQRWIVIFSEAAYRREVKTLKKNFRKGSEKELKEFEKLAEDFSCQKDAETSYKKALKKYKYLSINDFVISEVRKHLVSGRPKKWTDSSSCRLPNSRGTLHKFGYLEGARATKGIFRFSHK